MLRKSSYSSMLVLMLYEQGSRYRFVRTEAKENDSEQFHVPVGKNNRDICLTNECSAELHSDVHIFDGENTDGAFFPIQLQVIEERAIQSKFHSFC